MQGPRSRDIAHTFVPEVEFALVINRMIESIKTDPEHLRATVYELARHKLKEQFGAEPDIERLSDALEVAIGGVEAFSINKDHTALPGTGQVARLSAPYDSGAATAAAPYEYGKPHVVETSASTWRFAWSRKAIWFTAPIRFLVVLAIVLLVIIAAKQEGLPIDSLQKKANSLVWLLKGSAPKQAVTELPQTIAMVNPVPREKSPVTPTAFGIYAISGDKLYELELLPGRAPDLRVAISARILTPSRTTLPDGHLKFVVFRRDSTTNAADHAEIRVVAKVVREMSFEAAGKAVTSKPEDSWVIRNISIPYRTAPKKDEPDMYEILSETPDTALAPGRYALVLKGQAYDFSVAGEITDPKQCLERVAATNGQFYSECQKPMN
jgi:hypothetical protein